MRQRQPDWSAVALVLAVMAAGPVAAEPGPPGASPALPPGATPRTDVDSAIPLTPGMSRDLGRRVGADGRARRGA